VICDDFRQKSIKNIADFTQFFSLKAVKIAENSDHNIYLCFVGIYFDLPAPFLQ
jgi:hypothetical protein